jgi:hypothetical protein
MATYSTENHERIAVDIGQDVRNVVEHKRLFEWAADWYGLDRGLPRDAPPRLCRIPPSKMRGRWGSSSKRLGKPRVKRNASRSPSPKMLIPKRHSRDFCVGTRANSAKNRLYHSEKNLRGRELAEIREEFCATRQSKKFLLYQ